MTLPANRRAETLPAQLQDLCEQASAYVSDSRAKSTRKAYATDWRDFAAWCQANGLNALPADPQTVALYLTAQSGARKVSTLRRRMVAIRSVHAEEGHADPCAAAVVRDVMKGITRGKGVAPAKKAPLMVDDLRLIVRQLGNGLIDTRDRALLLIAFAGAFRRSELVAIDVADIERHRDGLVIALRRSKTNQDGDTERVGIPYGSRPETCPVRALDGWLEAAGIQEGRVFRSVNRHGHVNGSLSDKAVALIVKRRAEAVGLDADRFGGHSTRAGFATSAAAAGVSERAIMNQTRHKSVPVARGYIREGSLFRENAASSIGL